METAEQIEKWNTAITLFAESALKPDHELRQSAHEQMCYHELMYVRDVVLDYLNMIRK